MRQRPDHVTLNASHPSAVELVLGGFNPAGLCRSAYYHDSSTRSNHGNLLNMNLSAAWSWDNTLQRFRLNFDGTDDYVAIPQLGRFNFSAGPLSVSMWILEDSWLDTGWHRILSWYDGSRNVQVGKSSGKFYLISSASTVNNPTTAAASTGLHHIAFTYNGTTFTCYLDGRVSSDSQNSVYVFTGNTTTLYIGQRGNGAYMNGYLADLMIHRRVVSAAEIKRWADLSNVMYDGLLLPPEQTIWGGGVPVRLQHSNQRGQSDEMFSLVEE